MSHVRGTYSDGKVLLAQPVAWPDGMPVSVVSETEEATEDICLDGSAFDDSPEGTKRWLEWFDSLEPVFSGEDLARFEAALRTIRNEQRAIAGDWQRKIDHLLK
jgi:hypothetical protein